MGKLLSALLVFTGGYALADEFDGSHALSTDDRANIQLDQDKAHKEIEDRYKDDSSASARSAKMHELNDADSKVLKDHGTDDKAFLTQNMRTSPDEEKEVSSRKVELQAKRDADAKAKEDAAKAPKEEKIEMIKGFDEEHPLKLDEGGGAKKAPALDENGNPTPQIEKGFSEDEMAAKGETGEGGAKAEAPKDTEIAVPPSVEPGTQVIEAPSTP
jgi:hypothetical protein